MEAELVNEEADAAIMVTDENVDALDAEVGALRSGGGGHAGDYKAGRGAEEKDNPENLSG